MGRTGALTPVATLEPVHIGGIEVSHVSLHNQDEIDRKDIRVGDHVLVERAGDVIPHVVKVIKSKRNGSEGKYRLPDTCPVCGGEVARPADAAVARCTNSSCPAVLKETIKHFGSKRGLDIEGLGDKTVDQMVEKGIVKSVADLFELREEDVAALDRMGDKSARNLVEAVEESRNKVTLPRLVFALGIPHVGYAVAMDLAKEYGSIDALAEAREEDLEAMEGVGREMAEAIVAWFASERNRALVEELKGRGLDPPLEAKGGTLEGMKFVITGSLDSMTRDEAAEAIELNGGTVTGSVSSETDYLVVGENPGDAKQRAADSHGTERIGEKQLLAMLNGE